MTEDLKYIREDITEIKTSIVKLYDKLDPIVVDTALNKKSLERVWWFVGAITLLILGVSLKGVLTA